jgi:hypothetical protein
MKNNIEQLTYTHGIDNIFDYPFMSDFTTAALAKEVYNIDIFDIVENYVGEYNDELFYCFSEHSFYNREQLFQLFNVLDISSTNKIKLSVYLKHINAYDDFLIDIDIDRAKRFQWNRISSSYHLIIDAIGNNSKKGFTYWFNIAKKLLDENIKLENDMVDLLNPQNIKKHSLKM